MIRTIATKPFDDQKPGTSGLRKKVGVFRQRHYIENYVQAIFDAIGTASCGTMVLGGDGRFYNRQAIAIVMALAAGNGVKRLIVGQGGILSTPAASHLIGNHGAFGGIILSASHNPGGPDGDFGIKYNGGNGGPAPERLMVDIHENTKRIRQFKTAAVPDIKLAERGTFMLEDMVVDIVDPVAEYASLMESLFDFPAIRGLLATGFSLSFDAMHAVTGPYALEILEKRLGAKPGSVVNSVPSEDFGGGHPDPNPVNACQLFNRMMGRNAPDFGAASDGDGDRNLILGRGIFVTPSDSLAMIAANAHLIAAYRGGLKGIARSMPTSMAADKVAAGLGIALYETPTGWKHFGNLLDGGLVRLCGEESAGTGSDHVREKDGLWAVLAWLNILAVRRLSVKDLAKDHWNRFGRNYHARHDYEGLKSDDAEALIASLRGRIASLPGAMIQKMKIVAADDFSYLDPVDGSRTANQGIRILFEGGSRVVFRLSGTGTQGATLRVYMERYQHGPEKLALSNNRALGKLVAAASDIARIEHFTGRSEPTLAT